MTSILSKRLFVIVKCTKLIRRKCQAFLLSLFDFLWWWMQEESVVDCAERGQGLNRSQSDHWFSQQSFPNRCLGPFTPFLIGCTKYTQYKTQGPVDLKWACLILRIFARIRFCDFFTLFQRFSFVKAKSITYVQDELFSGMKLTNLGQFTVHVKECAGGV
jgi:hypothetical protein